MSEITVEEYQRLTKKAWIVFWSIVAAVVLFLVLVIASDNEERLFFAIFGIALPYVLRPTEASMQKHVKKYAGVSPPESLVIKPQATEESSDSAATTDNNSTEAAENKPEEKS